MIAFAASEVPARRGGRALRSLGYSAEGLGAAAQGFAQGRGWAAVRDGLSCQANPGQAEFWPLLALTRAISPQRAISPAPPGPSRADLTTGPSHDRGPSLGP